MVPEWVILHPEITDKALRLFCVLARFTGQDGTAFPKRQTLADTMGCSRDTVDRALAVLSKIGAVDIAHRFRRDGAKSSNEYRLALPKTPHRRGKVAAPMRHEEKLFNEIDLTTPPLPPVTFAEGLHVVPTESSEEEEKMDLKETALTILAERHLANRSASQEPINNKVKWIERVVERLQEEHHAKLLTAPTDLTPSELADFLEPPSTPRSEPGARIPSPMIGCRHCDRGVQWLDDNSVIVCPSCEGKRASA